MRRTLWFLAALGMACVRATGQVQAPDVPGQFAALKTRADPMAALIPSWAGVPTLISTHHWQAFARHPDPAQPYMYGIYASGTCTQLVVFRIGSADARSGGRLRSNMLLPGQDTAQVAPATTDIIVATMPLASDHCGSIAAAGKYLAVPFFSDCDGQATNERVVFFDISSPMAPTVAYTFNKPVRYDSHNVPIPYGTLFGNVGLCQLDNGHYFLAIGSGINNKFMNFAEVDPSNGWPPVYDTFASSLLPTGFDWPPGDGGGGDFAFQSFQLINPVEEPAVYGETIYMLGFRNTYETAVGNEEVWLVRLTWSEYVATFEQSYGARVFSPRTTDLNLANGTFNAGSSAYVSPDGELMLYSTEYYHSASIPVGFAGRAMKFTEYSSRFGSPLAAPAGGCTASVTLFTDQNFGGRSLTVDALDSLYLNLDALGNNEGGFSNNVSSMAWNLPPDCTCRLYDGPNFTGNFRDFTGLGSLSMFAFIGFNNNPLLGIDNRFESIQFFGGGCPAPTIKLFPGNGVTAALAGTAMGTGTCAMVKLAPGAYPAPVQSRLNRPGQYRSMGGLAELGRN